MARGGVGGAAVTQEVRMHSCHNPDSLNFISSKTAYILSDLVDTPAE